MDFGVKIFQLLFLFYIIYVHFIFFNKDHYWLLTYYLELVIFSLRNLILYGNIFIHKILFYFNHLQKDKKKRHLFQQF